MAAAVILAACSFALYSATIGFGFVDFDDRVILLSHPNLYGDGSLWADLRQIFLEYFPREEPLLIRDVSWAVESRLFGFASVWPRHLGNVVLNAMAVSLAFLYLRELTGRTRLAFGCALAWSLLAVRVEPVAWVMGRKDMLCAVFTLAALTLEAHAPKLRTAQARRASYCAALLATVAAVFSKMSALPLFAVLLMQRGFASYLGGSSPPGARIERMAWLRAAARYSPHFILSIASYSWYHGIVHQFGVTQRGPPFSFAYLRVLGNFLPLVAGEYAKLLAFPFDLSISHPWPSTAIALSAAELISSRFIAVGLLGFSALLAWRRRDLLFYWLAAWGLMTTYLNLVYIGIWVADRYLYLSSLFVVALLAILFVELLASRAVLLRAVAVGMVVGVLAVNAVQVVTHQRVWGSNEALWRYEVSRSEPSMLAFHALGRELLNQAEREPDRQRREALLAQADRTLDEGQARFAAYHFQPSPYFTNERYFAAKLLYLRGRSLEVRGAPPTERAAAFQRAAAADPANPATAVGLARSLFDLALKDEGPGREELLRRSLRAFAGYAAWATHDPVLVPAASKMLEDNYARFPGLAQEVADLRNMLKGGSR